MRKPLVIGSAGTSRGNREVRTPGSGTTEDGAGADAWRHGVVPSPRLE